MERITKRNPFIAMALSIVLPGLGQVYNVQLKKGLICYLVFFLSDIIILATRLATHFYGTVALIGIPIFIRLFAVADAIVIAVKSRQARLKRYNRWYYYLLFLIVAAGMSLAIAVYIKPKSASVRAFKLPTAAMNPTLLVGDRIITELEPYKHERPKRGDIIVFKYPGDPERDFIKRIIAVEGDTIQSIDKVIFLNDAPLDEPYAIHRDSEIKPGGDDPRDNFGPYVIPDGTLFVMGDNRDETYDSRYWGYVRADEVIGKAIYIYWSWDAENESVRYERIGRTIE